MNCQFKMVLCEKLRDRVRKISVPYWKPILFIWNYFRLENYCSGKTFKFLGVSKNFVLVVGELHPNKPERF
jgi:hypothetical protein